MEGLAQLSKPTTNYLVLLLVFFSFAIPLASFASTAYTYDKNGNMTFDGANTYTYDAKNQLTQSVAGDVTTHYTYDYDGQRLSATAINAKKGTSITTYTPSKTYTEIVDNNNPTAPHKTITRILSPGGDWKEIETQGTVTTERYIYTDHLGNVQVVTDEKGAPIQIQDYKTFGSQDLNDTSGTYDSSRKYIGQEFDQDTGLLYLNARYYNPAIGRFLSQDPVFWAIGDEKEVRRLTGKSQQEILMNPQNLNSYSYANNNPVTNSDPSGNYVSETQLYSLIGGKFDSGGIIASYRGINILSGGASTGTPKSAYQCAPLVSQFINAQYGFPTPLPSALDYGNVSKLNSKVPSSKGGNFSVYQNGDSTMPQQNDILSWTSSNQKYGHVGVIAEVEFNPYTNTGTVYTLEQNVQRGNALFSQTFSKVDGGYKINGGPKDGEGVQGWARYSAQALIAPTFWHPPMVSIGPKSPIKYTGK